MTESTNYDIINETAETEETASEDTSVSAGVGRETEESCEIFNDYENNTATGYYSHAEGEGTAAFGRAAHAEGKGTAASYTGAHAEGCDSVANAHGAHAEGYSTAEGHYSHSEGYLTKTTGENSHAEGKQTTASGLNSHAEGQSTTASGEASHSEGSNTTASGDKSHAEGRDSTAGGAGAHAEGGSTLAAGEDSHAEGQSTQALGVRSHAGGYYTIAEYDDQTVIGAFNDNKPNTLFEVGNGTDNWNRSNAFEVYKDGSVSVGGETITPAQLEKLINNLSNLGASVKFAKRLYAGQSYRDSISYSGEERWFRFTPNYTDEYVIYTTGSVDTKVYLYDSDYNRIAFGDEGGSGNNFRICKSLSRDKKYYLCVSGKSGSVGEFYVKVQSVSDLEPGSCKEAAIEIPLKGQRIDEFTTTRQTVWFKFTANASDLHKSGVPGRYCVGASSSTLTRLDAWLYNSDGESEEYVYIEKFPTSVYYEFMLTYGKTYYLRVEAIDNYTGEFFADVTYDASRNNTGKSRNDAIPLVLNRWVESSFDTAGQKKWFRFMPDDYFNWYTVLTESSLNTDGGIYDSSGQLIAAEDSDYPGNSIDGEYEFGDIKLTKQLEPYQIYYVCVHEYMKKTGSFKIRATYDVEAESVEISPSSVRIPLGEYYTLTATTYPSYSTDTWIEWTSDNSSIASVNNGVVRAKKVGKTTIRAISGSNSAEGTCTVEVYEATERVDFSSDELYLDVGESKTLSYTLVPSTASMSNVTWSSSNTNVATVDTSGKVTAKAIGTTTITAKPKNGIATSCTVKVMCGGSNYKDVTQHTMVLQEDGYYVCSKCGYSVKSPALQDKDILSFEDYLKVVCCQMHYSHVENLIQCHPELSDLRGCQNIVMQMVSEIRQQLKYTGKYGYSDINGKCIGLVVDYDYGNSIISMGSPSISDIVELNELVDTIHEYILGYFCPGVSIAKSIVDLFSQPITPLTFCKLIIDEFGPDELSESLSIAANFIDFVDTDIDSNDIIIAIVTNRSVNGKYIFSASGELKKVVYNI